MEVFLNVYDLPDQENRNNALQGVGVGFYHTGVQINNAEYSYSAAGVSRTAPQLQAFGRLREHILVGEFTGSASDLATAIQKMGSNNYRSGTYNLIHHNCNNFSDAFCVELTGLHIPDYVNRAARVAANFVKDEGKENREKVPDTVFAMPGAVRAPGDRKSAPKTVDAQGEVQEEEEFSITSHMWNYMFGSSKAREEEKAAKTARKQAQEAFVPANKKKKELTEAQKAALAKLKSNK